MLWFSTNSHQVVTDFLEGEKLLRKMKRKRERERIGSTGTREKIGLSRRNMSEKTKEKKTWSLKLYWQRRKWRRIL